MTAVLSDNKSSITISPSEILSVNTTYWYGVKEEVIEYKETNTAITGLSATFSTTSTAVTMVTYNDFDGNSLTTVSESMGDPAGSYETVADPKDGANMVTKWVKGNSWGGWERIHFQLNAPYDAAKDDIFSFRVYSSVKTNYMFKIADAKGDGDQNANLEKYGEITVANQWQTIYFDASELADGISFDHIFIFIGPGNGAITGDFYIDDLKGPQLQGTASTNDFEKATVQFFPNPANDAVRFDWGMPLSEAFYAIYSYGGQKIEEGQFTGKTFSIATSDWAAGSYFIRATHSDGTLTTSFQVSH